MEIRKVYNQLHDDLSLAVHALFLERLRKDSSLLPSLQERWDRWDRKEYPVCDPRYRQCRLDAIQSGIDAVGEICLREDDLGQVLRSCSPIFLWESDEERLEYMREFREAYRETEACDDRRTTGFDWSLT